MIKAIKCSALSVVLEKLKEIVKINEGSDKKTIIFCEDRLTLAAERAVCSAVDGSFLTSVYTFARFLTAERGKCGGVLSSRGSAMAVRKIMEEHKGEFSVFKKAGAAGTAQSVYDTIALLYSSKISAEELQTAAEKSGELKSKLSDIALVYSEYVKYLRDNGLQDRNGYLRQASQAIAESGKIKGGSVVFLGFQAFTGTTSECVKAAFESAESVYGLFVGGEEDLYVNEAYNSFVYFAKDFGGAEEENAHIVLNGDAEVLRRRLFNPESYHIPPEPCSFVRVFEASDREDELEFIAASIKKHVLDYGERYAKISVMIPDLENCERAVARVFSRYEIPYFADIRYPLSRHSLGAFILDFLHCAASGCRMQDVNRAVSSPLFPADRADKDIFKNYMLRFRNFRGGVKTKPDPDILKNSGFDSEAVERVRNTFLKGYEALTKKGVNSGICGGLRNLLALYGVEKRLRELSEQFQNDKPLSAGFSARAYEAAESVIAEAESIGGELPLSEFIKLVSTGFAAMKISIIPPKSDAVFVGDLTSTANIGTNVVFAAGLTEGVPSSTADTALISDREIAVLESVNLNISPKIRQVNLRTRETIALNICAFKKNLYLTYPAQTGGEEHTPSEIISYACAIFTTQSGSALKCADLRRVKKSPRSLPYYCSELTPALERLKEADERETSAIYSVLKERGLENRAIEALTERARGNITCGKGLYLKYGSLSPTALETYFSCPYLAYMRQGLGVQEREEGAVRAVDTGNFVHAVLEDTAKEAEKYESEKEFEDLARTVAEEKLKNPPYSTLADSKSGEYLSGELINEAVKICLGMYAQLKNSSFKVAYAESKCDVNLSDGVKIYGRIDRVDECGDMVRIIDYKTGKIDASPAKYYSGAKLQLPLYLLSASENKRPVGAYYFPAACEYTPEKDGVFRLKGFMDGSEEVVRASDGLVEPKMKSVFVDAYLNGRSVDAAMPSGDFPYFLQYSRLASDGAAKEMLAGNITPSPAEGVCEYCRAGGSCGFACGVDGGERKTSSVKCTQIAELVKSLTEDGNE